MKLYGIKTCDSCRRAIKALGERANFVDVRRDGVPDDVLETAFAQFGGKLVNKSSTTWRGFDEAQKASDPLALLRENPTLMKRPLIVDGADMTLGWTEDVQRIYA